MPRLPGRAAAADGTDAGPAPARRAAVRRCRAPERLARGARLRDPGRAGPRRHGGRLPGPAAPAQPHRGAEDDPRLRARRPNRKAALPDRDGSGGPPATHAYRATVRGRRGAWPAVLLAGVLRRRHARPAVEEAAALPAGGRRVDRDAGAGDALRASAWGGPSRPEAGQRAAGRAGAGGEDHRLRSSQAHRRRGPRPEPVGCDHGHSIVYGARAGGWQGP